MIMTEEGGEEEILLYLSVEGLKDKKEKRDLDVKLNNLINMYSITWKHLRALEQKVPQKLSKG